MRILKNLRSRKNNLLEIRRPPVFLQKSAELAEKKRVEFLASAEKYKKEQESAEEFERKRDRSKTRWQAGKFEGGNVEDKRRRSRASREPRWGTLLSR